MIVNKRSEVQEEKQTKRLEPLRLGGPTYLFHTLFFFILTLFNPFIRVSHSFASLTCTCTLYVAIDVLQGVPQKTKNVPRKTPKRVQLGFSSSNYVSWFAPFPSVLHHKRPLSLVVSVSFLGKNGTQRSNNVRFLTVVHCPCFAHQPICRRRCIPSAGGKRE